MNNIFFWLSAIVLFIAGAGLALIITEIIDYGLELKPVAYWANVIFWEAGSFACIGEVVFDEWFKFSKHKKP